MSDTRYDLLDDDTFEQEMSQLDGELEAKSRKEREYNSPKAVTERRIMAMLEKLGGQTLHDESIERGGDKIRLPEEMSLQQAERFIRQQRKALEESMEFHRTFNYRPWDGAWCMWNAMKRVFGAVSHEEAIRMGFFGPEKEPPRFIDVPCGVNETEQVPWGALRIPALPDVLFTLDQVSTPTGPLFSVGAEGPRKHRAKVEGVFKLIADELRENSLYRGKAIDGAIMPNFIDLSSVESTKVVYSTEAYESLQANVWTPIQHAQKLKELGLSTKRSVLLHGEWGTGKTLAAGLTAQVATRHGWTFIRARPGQDDLNLVMQTATLYAPAVVFFEDIDVISDASKLDSDEASKLLDSFDGLAAKGIEVLAVMTTNHIERIHKGMVRPGRLDAVIQLGALDGPNVVNLLLRTIPERWCDEASIEARAGEVAEAYSGYTPAYIVEAAGRAIRYAVSRTEAGEQNVTINADDVISAAEGLRNQFQIMQDASHTPPERTLDAELAKVVAAPILEDLANRFD